jgi:predicted nucleic acid-binding protein
LKKSRRKDLKISDFEDAIIAAIAMREKTDYIITRNTKDFSKSPVPAITPDTFLVNAKEALR